MLTGPYRLPALFIAVSSLLLIMAFVAGGFSSEALGLIPIGLAGLLATVGLLRSWRWLAYLAFLATLFGAIIAFASSFGPSSIPGWWFILIMALDLCAAILLFIALWRDPVAIR